MPIGASVAPNDRYMQWAGIWRKQVSLGEKWSIAGEKKLNHVVLGFTTTIAGLVALGFKLGHAQGLCQARGAALSALSQRSEGALEGQREVESGRQEVRPRKALGASSVSTIVTATGCGTTIDASC